MPKHADAPGVACASAASWTATGDAAALSGMGGVSSDLGVAVCLVGFVRTLGRPDVYRSLASHFHSHAGMHADFFGVVSSGGDDTAKGQWADVPADEYAPALRALQPAAWDDFVDHRGHRCGLLCMRQYDRLSRCREMIEEREQRCGGTYAWVVKARPDVTVSAGGARNAAAPRTLAADGLHISENVVYKDRRAGDMVVYMPRRLLGNVSRVLAETPCDEVRRHGVDCTHAAAATGGGNCKCNAWLSVGVARVLGLRLAYHSYRVEVVRTHAAHDVIERARRRFGGDGMRALHNKSREVL